MKTKTSATDEYDKTDKEEFRIRILVNLEALEQLKCLLIRLICVHPWLILDPQRKYDFHRNC